MSYKHSSPSSPILAEFGQYKDCVHPWRHNVSHFPNGDEVQVKDLSESKAQVHHMQLINSEHKPNILDNHLSAYNLQSSTTTKYPAIRHRPVSVVKLFSR